MRHRSIPAVAVLAFAVLAASLLSAAPSHAATSRAPKTFVTAQHATIVAVSTATGKAVRTLTRPPAGWTDSQPFLSDDGKTVAFVRENPALCRSGILAVPFRGGAVRALVPIGGSMLDTPRLSRDGALLAYNATRCDAGPPTLQIRTLRTGATHAISAPTSFGALDFTFDPTGRRVLTVFPTTRGTQVWSIPVRARNYLAGKELKGAIDPGCHARRLARIGRSHDIALDEYCPGVGPERVTRIDARNGRHVGTLAVVPGATEIGLNSVDYDVSGRYLLMQGMTGVVYTVRHGKLVVLMNGMPGRPLATW